MISSWKMLHNNTFIMTALAFIIQSSWRRCWSSQCYSILVHDATFGSRRSSMMPNSSRRPSWLSRTSIRHQSNIRILHRPDTRNLDQSDENNEDQFISGSDPEENSDNHLRRRIPILQYHNDWVCVNKPAGMTVHRSKKTPKHQAVLTSTVKRQLCRKVFPVHRLDHRTSGAILFAFDSKTAGRLHECAIRNGRKQYLALLRGPWRITKDTIAGAEDCNDRLLLPAHHVNATITIINETSCIVDKPLLVQSNDWDNKSGVLKDARTMFTLIAETTATINTGSNAAVTDDRASAPTCCLVLCEPLESGRTHQIRRHAYALGQPILGDSQHGDSRMNRFWRKYCGLGRLALHCWMIDFSADTKAEDDVKTDAATDNDDEESDEGRGELPAIISCLAPIPNDLRDALERIPQLWEDALMVEPRLAVEPYDIRGGTFGRNYKKKKDKATTEIA